MAWVRVEAVEMKSLEGPLARNVYSRRDIKRVQSRPEEIAQGKCEHRRRPRRDGNSFGDCPFCHFQVRNYRLEGSNFQWRNTHQKMVPNFMFLQSSVKSSKRTLSVSWKRLSSNSQSVFRPGGVPMPTQPAPHEHNSLRRAPRKPGHETPPPAT